MASHEASGRFAFAAAQASPLDEETGHLVVGPGLAAPQVVLRLRLGRFFLRCRQLEQIVLSNIFPAVGLLAAARRAEAAARLSASRPSLFLQTWCSSRAQRERLARLPALAGRACRTLQAAEWCCFVLLRRCTNARDAARLDRCVW